MVIILVGEVKSAIVVVVADIVVDHDHRSPGVEEAVGDDGSEGRTADDVVAIDVAAIDTVVEVVGDTVVVDRSDVVRDMHVTVVVVVVRVYVGIVRGGAVSGTRARAVSGASVLVITTGVTGSGAFRAGGGDGLRGGRSLGRVSASFRGGGAGRSDGSGSGSRTGRRGGRSGCRRARGARGRSSACGGSRGSARCRTSCRGGLRLGCARIAGCRTSHRGGLRLGCTRVARCRTSHRGGLRLCRRTGRRRTSRRRTGSALLRLLVAIVSPVQLGVSSLHLAGGLTGGGRRAVLLFSRRGCGLAACGGAAG